ncbi:MAG TPA: RNA polymerase-binding protein DksA [Thermodesulfobacteriota bacterium]|nr:RNA polymerase-binding protein DksA [Thermodesulfobacteriota bacterium]
MTPDRLAVYKALLERQLEELLREAGRTLEGMGDERESFPDPGDRASLESERNFTLRIRERERKLIGKIREALARIEAGTFGVCETCGEPIGEARLLARPVTTQCIECKTAAEAAERRRPA